MFLSKIIGFSIQHKSWVGFAIVLWTLWGAWSLYHLPIDAVPDITNHQVQLVTTAPHLSAGEMELMVTEPLERRFFHLQGLVNMRSLSRYGLSVITLVIEEDMDPFHARQLVSERLKGIENELSPGVNPPEMLPMTTGLGEIVQYRLKQQPNISPKYTLQELRFLQDYRIKPLLAGIPGITEISTFGGYEPGYTFIPDPHKLRSANMDLLSLKQQLLGFNLIGGGGYQNIQGKSQYYQLDGRLNEARGLEQISVQNRQGKTFRLWELGHIDSTAETLRFGALTADGQGEVVGGIALLTKGANAFQVSQQVSERIAEIQTTLPKGLEIQIYLDRAKLVGRTIRTVKTNLMEGGLIVLFVLILFLGHLRAGLVVASVIPLSMLFAAGLMRTFNLSGNLMSLGAIDFGLMVDGAVVLVEGVLHSLHRQGLLKNSAEVSNRVSLSVSKRLLSPALFGQLIILVVYIPILSLQGVEGKMFKPMAFTVIFAMTGAILLSFTYVPAMTAALVAPRPKSTGPWADWLFKNISKGYTRVLRFSLRKGAMVISLSLLLLGASIVLFTQQGTEFIPTLEEGDLAMQMTVPPGTPLDTMVAKTQRVESALIQKFPEVRSVVSKIGTSEIPTDPMGLEDADIMILLEPKELWTTAQNREALVDSMKFYLQGIPNASFEFTQPIELRFNELLSGAKSDLVFKVYGPNRDSLVGIGKRMEVMAEQTRGASDIKLDVTEGLPMKQWKPNYSLCQAHGISPDELNQLLELASSGTKLSDIRKDGGLKSFSLRLPQSWRAQKDAWQYLQIQAKSGELLPLGLFLSAETRTGPVLISREKGQRFIALGINVRNRDMGSLVEELQTNLKMHLNLPPGYTLSVGGDFENLNRAKKRLLIALPLALVLIAFLLLLALKQVLDAAGVFLAIPFSAIGGIFMLYAFGLPFSISAGIGFIALFGIAVLNGLVMVNGYKNKQFEGHSYLTAVWKGSLERVRPVLMTATVAALGFLPMAFSTGDGAEVQRPLALVVIGGLVSSTLLTLIILPIVFIERFKRFGKNKALTGLALLCLFGTAQAQVGPQQVMDLAQQHAPEVHVWEKELQAAAPLAKFRPNLGSTDLLYQRGQINGLMQDYFVTLSQDLGNPVSWFTQKAEGQRFLELQQEKLNQSILQNQWLALSAWVDWTYQTLIKQLIEQEYELLLQEKSLLKIQEETGQSGKAAWLLADLQAMRLQQDMDEAQHKKDHAFLMLKHLCGDSLRPDVDTAAYWEIGFLASPQKPNPSLLVAHAETQWAQAQWKHAQSRHLPRFHVGYFTQQLEGQPGFNGWQVGGSFPLFSMAQYAQTRSLALNTRVYEAKSILIQSQSQVALKQAQMEQQHLTQRKEELEAYLQKNLEALAALNLQLKQGGLQGQSLYLQSRRELLKLRQEWLGLQRQLWFNLIAQQQNNI